MLLRSICIVRMEMSIWEKESLKTILSPSPDSRGVQRAPWTFPSFAGVPHGGMPVGQQQPSPPLSSHRSGSWSV